MYLRATTLACPFGTALRGSALVSLVVLFGCSGKTPEDAMTACRTEMRKSRDLQLNEEKASFLQNCMRSKGWHPADNCRELRQDDGDSCVYER